MTVSALAADTPATEDLLGFTPHAQRLAATILQGLPERQSFVIGIEGEWGEGKSSFINFLKHRLNVPEAGEIQPAIVEFNPWWYEGSDKLLSHLLETLIHQLNTMEALDKESRQALIQFFKALDGAAPVIEKTSKAWLPLLGFVVTGAAVAQLQWVGAVLGVLVSVVVKSALDHFQKTPSLEDLRCKLVTKPGYHTHTNQKVVVIIDDLDRLPRDEIQQLFRVIKGVLNLPNIVYVIAYDRKIVASALSDFHKDSGEAYLEKIIQYPYALPRPHMSDRLAYNKRIIASYLHELPDGIGNQGVARVVSAFLKVPRSVKRLSGAMLDYQYGCHVDMEIDGLDYFFLESVRHFDTSVFHEIINALMLSAQYGVLPQRSNFSYDEGVATQLSWVREKLKTTIEKYGSNAEIIDCLRYFTGFAFSDEHEELEITTNVRSGNRVLAHAVLSVRMDSSRRLVRSYLARQRDHNEVSRLEIEAFVMLETTCDFFNFIENIGQDKVLSLLLDVDLYWNSLYRSGGKYGFLELWARVIQEVFDRECLELAGLNINEVLGIYENVLHRSYRERPSLVGNPGEIVRGWLDSGLMDDLVYYFTLHRNFLVGFPGVEGDVLDALLEEKCFGRMLFLNFFEKACCVIKLKKPFMLNDWLLAIECDEQLAEIEKSQFFDFIASSFVRSGDANVLQRNSSFMKLLNAYRREIEQSYTRDSELQEGYKVLKGYE